MNSKTSIRSYMRTVLIILSLLIVLALPILLIRNTIIVNQGTIIQMSFPDQCVPLDPTTSDVHKGVAWYYLQPGVYKFTFDCSGVKRFKSVDVGTTEMYEAL